MSDRSEQTALLEGPRRNYKELSNKFYDSKECQSLLLESLTVGRYSSRLLNF